MIQGQLFHHCNVGTHHLYHRSHCLHLECPIVWSPFQNQVFVFLVECSTCLLMCPSLPVAGCCCCWIKTCCQSWWTWDRELLNAQNFPICLSSYLVMARLVLRRMLSLVCLTSLFTWSSLFRTLLVLLVFGRQGSCIRLSGLLFSDWEDSVWSILLLLHGAGSSIYKD